MAGKPNHSVILFPVGIMLVVIGTAAGRSDAVILGLSGQFWSGFLLALAVGTLLTSIILTTRKSRS